MEPQTPSKSKLSVAGWSKFYRILRYISVFLVIVVIFGFILREFGVIVKGKVYFTVVVDCGSTGTRVNVYQWRITDVTNRDLPVLLHSYPDELMKKSIWHNGCKYHCIQTEPGLDKFIGNYSQVKASLEPLIKWAEGLIPHDKCKDSPIFVLATAGLRRVSLEDANLVLDDVERVIKEHSFKWRRDWIRVLSGKEEAYYGWVALNYKMGFLGNSSKLPTLGLLDLGGSSLQVVVESDDVRDEDDEHFTVSKIGRVEHKLMAYSLPEFGLNQAFDRSVNQAKLLEKDEIGSYEVRHPCLGSMYVADYYCGSCFKTGSLVRLIGDSNWEKCKLLAHGEATNSSVFNWVDPGFNSSCRRNSIDESENALNLSTGTNPSLHYHALSGFFAIYTLLNLTVKSNITQIREKAKHLCSTWANPNNVSGNQYCFKVLYLASLIEDGLCLGDADITFGPGDISWTLGVSLVEEEHIRRTSSRLNMEVVSSPVILFVMLSVVFFIVYRCQIKLPMTRKRSDVVDRRLH